MRGKGINVYRILVEKPHRKQSFGRQRDRRIIWR
jgi:hypothetical protein